MTVRNLLALASDNRGKGTGLRAQAEGDDWTALYVYDVIDSWWGVSAAAFAQALNAITTPNIALRINSPGGDVFEARAMMTALKDHPANIVAKIDGLAASAATALTLACDSVEIADGGFYMIHQAWTFAMGNADELTATAGLLNKIDDVLVDGYVGKSGKSADDVRALMKAETWFNAQEAIDAGFADSLMATTSKSADARAFNLAAFANAPKALTAPPEPDAAASRERFMSRLGLYERTA
ncbi:head maturation protease, ClpP-related [Sphingomonas sp. IW22]|uniref:head maturation protease, ClpP-related n=1 Tax=Sphingomonas sp. IW22 TaxID=3242489 RepID=UPI003522B0DD